MAQSFPLSTPLTLQNGQTITSVSVPPFAFVGRGGRSSYLYSPDYTDFEPRAAFAWSPEFLKAHRVTIRGGYGLSHAPITGFVRLPGPDFSGTSNAYGLTTGQVDPNYVMRLGENGPALNVLTPDQAIFGLTGVPSNGLIYNGSLYYQQNSGGYAVSSNVHTPYVQNWNFTISWQADRSTTVELSYQGAKGTHLFMPRENIDPKSVPLLNALDAQNISTTGTINDPLGRINPTTGKFSPSRTGRLPVLTSASLRLPNSTTLPPTAFAMPLTSAWCIAPAAV